MVARAILALRQGNRALTAQHNLSLDFNTISNELDEFNAQRCMAHGWNDFVQDVGTGPPQPVFPSPQRLRPLAAATNAVKRPLIGVNVVKDWLGDGLKPVASELSEKRAAICADCPQNQDPNFIQKLAAVAAEGLRSLMVIRGDLGAKTTLDEKLHSCQVCDCALQLKVHTPIEHIIKRTPPDIMAKFLAVRTRSNQLCWIVSESAK